MPVCYCNNRKVTRKCCSNDFSSSSDEDECKECLLNEMNLIKLKNTNYELKDLIHRLDKLSTSVDSKLKHQNHHHTYNHETQNRTNVYLNECNLCKSNNIWNKMETYQYDLTICDECKKMIRLAQYMEEKEIEERKLNRIRKKDPNVYPLSKYPSGRQFECDKCETCIYERSRSRSKSRRRRHSRTRSRSYGSYSPVSNYRVKTPEPRPVWNGGPYGGQAYLWREWKLKEEKRD